MGLTVCPAAVVAAPLELVWENLVHWERWSAWADVQAERSEPEGSATIGQTITFTGKAFGRSFPFIFKVEAVNPESYQLGLYAFSPLGLQMKPLAASIEDGLQRLKRASERRYQQAQTEGK